MFSPLLQLPLLVSSMVSVYFLEWTDIFKPVRWGFSCHDRSLSLPYIEPTHEVIPFLMLLSLAFAAPAITVSLTLYRYTHTRSARCTSAFGYCILGRTQAVGLLLMLPALL